MDEDEYDDELPPISVNSSSQDESVFAMPSAEVLASQRAREEECERELLHMRAQHEQQESAIRAAHTVPLAPSRSDSSGSDGESALASAVEALRVGNSVPSATPRPAASSLLASLLQHLPQTAGTLCQSYADAINTGQDLDTLTDDIITGIESWLCGLAIDTAEPTAEGEHAETSIEQPTEEEVLGVGGWLCAAVLWHAPDAPRARARRALHALLAAAADAHVLALCGVLVPAVTAARVRLELSASLSAAGARAGAGGGGAALLAAAVLRAALTDLLQPARQHDAPAEIQPVSLTTAELADLATRGWRELGLPSREVALQLLGRALAAAKHAEAEAGEGAGEGAERARVLAALAQPPAAAHADRHHPDHLKIAVAASKLKILLTSVDYLGK